MWASLAANNRHTERALSKFARAIVPDQQLASAHVRDTDLIIVFRWLVVVFIVVINKIIVIPSEKLELRVLCMYILGYTVHCASGDLTQ